MESGKTLRDKGIKQADTNADILWRAEAMAAVRVLCQKVNVFTTDDVWALVKSSTHEKRAMGGVMLWAQSEGLVKPSQSWKQSLRASSHRRPLRVWEVVR